jgi:hypothetical protein
VFFNPANPANPEILSILLRLAKPLFFLLFSLRVFVFKIVPSCLRVFVFQSPHNKAGEIHIPPAPQVI